MSTKNCDSIMKRIYYLIISLVTSSIIIFEISLTRLFSIYLSYHFAFIVISIAMLGIGSAGTILFLGTKRSNGDLERRLSVYALLTGTSIIMSYTISNYIPFDPVKLSWDRMQIFYLSLYCFIFSMPFFFSGMMIATAFYILSRNAQSIYAADLLGAGTGSVYVILVLNNRGPEYAIISASIISLISSLIIGNKRLRYISTIFILLNIFFLIFHPDLVNIKISPYKNLSIALRYPNSEHLKTYNHSMARIDIFRSPMIRFAPGLSLKYTEPLPEQIGIAVDGGELHAVTQAGNEESLRFLDLLPSAIAYRLQKPERALIIDPKGGLQVLMARRYRVKEIYKIESNPLLIEVIRKDLGSFSGGIYKHNTWTGLGRNFIQKSEPYLYDIIDISMTEATVSSFFGIMEDYRYTVEAFMEYLSGLKDNGILSISMYLIPPPRKEFRTLATVITALEKTGIKKTGQNIIAIRSWNTLTMLIKKTPFSDKEIEEIKEFTKKRGFDFIYYPGIKEKDTEIYIKTHNREYYRGFKSIIDPQKRSQFINNYLFDIKPVYDENPFFHYYLKVKNTLKIYDIMGRKWLYFIEEGYLTPFIFIIILLLSTFMILIPVFVKGQEARPDLEVLIYFSMLGLGFMFIEVALIQRHILVLENPIYSLSLILIIILISSGMGSMLSARFRILLKRRILIVLALIVLIYSLIQSWFFKAITPLPLSMKIPLISLSIIPQGLLMGIPFPLGIRLLGEKRAFLIPWAWAVNAFFSVMAPVITIMIATLIGFKGILWLASTAYAVAFVMLKRL